MLHLDVLRAVAAQLVLIGHSYSLLVTTNLSSYGSKDPSITLIEKMAWKLIDIFTGRGTDAVYVFFVLSGFLVGCPALQQFKRSSFDPKTYFLKRVARMYSVIIPAILISGFGMYFAFTYGNGSQVIQVNTPWYPPDWDIASSISLTTGVCNALFLQSILCPQFAHNASLWSLSNEFLYYSFIALILITLSGFKRPAKLTFVAFFGRVAIIAFCLIPSRHGDFGRT
jgi:peptidoglycan/LPS O-acetylase OafA/YrhL